MVTWYDFSIPSAKKKNTYRQLERLKPANNYNILRVDGVEDSSYSRSPYAMLWFICDIFESITPCDVFFSSIKQIKVTRPLVIQSFNLRHGSAL